VAGALGKLVDAVEHGQQALKRSSVRPASSLARLLKASHQFHVCGIQELIDRGHSLETISAIDEDTRIAREGCRIARDRDHSRNRRRRERPRLRLGALPWRIEHDGIEALEFDRHEGAAEEVAIDQLGQDFDEAISQFADEEEEMLPVSRPAFRMN